jgi:lipopolysaccharide transport protein LptA
MRALRTATLGVCLALAGPGLRAESTTNTIITSERLVYDYKRAIAVFEENVVVRDPQMTLTSDRMNVIFDAENNVKSVTAIGNVRIVQDNKTGLCDQAVYIALTGEIIMTGAPRLQRDGDTLQGNKITFWTNEDRVTCDTAKLVIHSESEANPLAIGE